MNGLLDLDQSVLLRLNKAWASPWADRFFVYFTDFHQTTEFKFFFLPLILLIIIWTHKWAGLRNIVFLAVSLALSDFFAGNVLKKFFQRSRPLAAGVDVVARAHSSGWSFPSAHASNIFCAAVFLGCHYPRWRWYFYSFALMISYSRSYVGAHYPLDWLCGSIFGASLGYLMYRLQRFLEYSYYSRKTEK